MGWMVCYSAFTMLNILRAVAMYILRNRQCEFALQDIDYPSSNRLAAKYAFPFPRAAIVSKCIDNKPRLLYSCIESARMHILAADVGIVRLCAVRAAIFVFIAAYPVIKCAGMCVKPSACH